MKKIVLVGFMLLTFLSTANALVPVEGILLGSAVEEYQKDPLFRIFNDIYDKTKISENKKLRLYKSTFDSGQYLSEGCGLYAKPLYPTPWMEKQAKRTVVATVQYIGLDTSIKAIGAYAKKLDLTEDEFKNLSTNMVSNFCSKNVTVFSLKKIFQSLDYYYKNPQFAMIPSVDSSPFATSVFKEKTESQKSRSHEFDQAIQNFKAFCSWGGDVEDYRLLSPYLKNKFIMAFIIKNLTGVQDEYDETKRVIVQKSSLDTVQVACKELICRKTSMTEFKESIPLSIGSTGLFTDMAKLYCHHFKVLDYSSINTIPNVKDWIKKMELEDPIFETNFFISLMTGVPDPIWGVESYRDIPAVARSGIDERWSKWANETLSMFSDEMLFEESLKIKPEPIRDQIRLKMNGFMLDFSVTLGEMDRVLTDEDKLKLSFDLKFSKNYLRHIRQKWESLSKDIDEDGKQKFRQEVAKVINVQLAEKERYFSQRVWNNEFSRHIAQELIGQLMVYNGSLFQSYEEKMLKVPVQFSYGVFALGYLRYRADVKSGRLKLN